MGPDYSDIRRLMYIGTAQWLSTFDRNGRLKITTALCSYVAWHCHLPVPSLLMRSCPGLLKTRRAVNRSLIRIAIRT